MWGWELLQPEAQEPCLLLMTQKGRNVYTGYHWVVSWEEKGVSLRGVQEQRTLKSLNPTFPVNTTTLIIHMTDILVSLTVPVAGS